MLKKTAKGIIANTISIAFAILFVSPVFFVFINALKPLGAIIKTPFKLPDSLFMDSINYVVKNMDFFRALTNTILYTAIIVSGTILVSAMAGWMLIRDNSRLSKIITVFFISSLLVPFHTIMIPIAQIARFLGISDSVFGYIWIQITLYSPMGIFMYEGFVKNVPTSVEEAARIDGASTIKTFFQIVFPMLKPITGSVAVLYSLWAWNDYLLAKIMLARKSIQTITLAVQQCYSAYLNRWDYAIAAVAISIVPILIVYILLQKNIIEGVAAGAVKG